MVDLNALFNPDGDLEKPVWFYAHVERLSDDAYEAFGRVLEGCPFGTITYDQIYNSLASTPIRLMAFAQGDEEIGNFLVRSTVSSLFMEAAAK